jgi:hypothetical protein
MDVAASSEQLAGEGQAVFFRRALFASLRYSFLVQIR